MFGAALTRPSRTHIAPACGAEAVGAPVATVNAVFCGEPTYQACRRAPPCWQLCSVRSGRRIGFALVGMLVRTPVVQNMLRVMQCVLGAVRIRFARVSQSQVVRVGHTHRRAHAPSHPHTRTHTTHTDACADIHADRYTHAHRHALAKPHTRASTHTRTRVPTHTRERARPCRRVMRIHARAYAHESADASTRTRTRAHLYARIGTVKRTHTYTSPHLHASLVPTHT